MSSIREGISEIKMFQGKPFSKSTLFRDYFQYYFWEEKLGLYYCGKVEDGFETKQFAQCFFY